MNLIIAYNAKNTKQWLLYSEYPNLFVKELKKLSYPNAYLACFMKNCENTAMWGYYGDKHSGVCLIYNSKIDGDENYLVMNGKNIKLSKVDYGNKSPEINFFESLGRITMYAIDSQWYTDYKGEKSYYKNIFDGHTSEEEWRKKYWNVFQNSFQVKFDEWKDEEEYRLVLPDTLNSRAEKESRKLRYNFKDLEGIIFGYKTSMKVKQKIISVIEEKCKEEKREIFNFYQADFSKKKNKMNIRKLEFIKFN
ncbi:hypothetical protein ES705_49152 [subsurface metagenome]